MTDAYKGKQWDDPAEAGIPTAAVHASRQPIATGTMGTSGATREPSFAIVGEGAVVIVPDD